MDINCCLVTICIGEKYLKEYNKLFRSSHETYAKKCGYDLEVDHQQVTKRLKDLQHNWINSFKLQDSLEGYQAIS